MSPQTGATYEAISVLFREANDSSVNHAHSRLFILANVVEASSEQTHGCAGHLEVVAK